MENDCYSTWRLRGVALLMSGIYMLLGILWVGGVLLDFGGLTLGLEKTSKLALDCAFALVTSAALYFTLEYTFRRIHHSERAIRAERALRQSDEHLRGVVHNSPLAIVTLDANGKVLTWNRAAEQLYGWSAADVKGACEPSVLEASRDDDRA